MSERRLELPPGLTRLGPQPPKAVPACTGWTRRVLLRLHLCVDLYRWTQAVSLGNGDGKGDNPSPYPIVTPRNALSLRRVCSRTVSSSEKSVCSSGRTYYLVEWNRTEIIGSIRVEHIIFHPQTHTHPREADQFVKGLLETLGAICVAVAS